ncbi:sugar nucleotide-binding protein [Candidatus Beckwithbacteria bacterium]|nr:sugar nucleotide-binding protein [Candidatus Beckwithbacteria bacterium]
MIFCTGSSGLVASQFKQDCINQGLDFIGLDLHGENQSVDILDKDNVFQAIEGKLREGIKPVLFHFAAITFTGKNLSSEQESLSWRLNVQGTKNILEVGKKLDIPVVHISTDYVFAGGTKEDPYLETDAILPDDTVYSQTKAAAEEAVLEVAKNQQVVIMRIAFPYGNLIHPKMGLLRKMLSWMDKNQTVNLYADQKICPTSIDFISQTCMKISQLLETKLLSSGQILHVVGPATTPYAFGAAAAQIFEKNCNITATSIEDNGAKNLSLSSQETEKILTMTHPSHDEEILRLKSVGLTY